MKTLFRFNKALVTLFTITLLAATAGAMRRQMQPYPQSDSTSAIDVGSATSVLSTRATSTSSTIPTVTTTTNNQQQNSDHKDSKESKESKDSKMEVDSHNSKESKESKEEKKDSRAYTSLDEEFAHSMLSQNHSSLSLDAQLILFQQQELQKTLSAIVTLTTSDNNTFVQIPASFFSTSKLFDQKLKSNGGLNKWFEDLQTQNALNFPSTDALNTFCQALKTIYQAQNKARSNNTEYYPRAVIHVIEPLLQKLSDTERFFIQKLAATLQIPELAIGTICQLCEANGENQSPWNKIILHCGHTLCHECLAKIYKEHGNFTFSQTTDQNQQTIYLLHYTQSKTYNCCPYCRKQLNDDEVKQILAYIPNIYPQKSDFHLSLINFLYDFLQNYFPVYPDFSAPFNNDSESRYQAACHILMDLLASTNPNHKCITSIYKALRDSKVVDDRKTLIDKLVAGLYLPKFTRDDIQALEALNKLLEDKKKEKTPIKKLFATAYKNHPAYCEIVKHLPQEASWKQELLESIPSWVEEQVSRLLLGWGLWEAPIAWA